MFDFEEAERAIRQEGYEDGCNDGYLKALEDVIELFEDEDPEFPLTLGVLREEVEELHHRAGP